MLFKLSVPVVACLLGSTTALPSGEVSARADDHSYIAPGPYDSRSPCPGLNTLANHGYIPRNGRNVSSADINNGFLNGFGMDSSSFASALSNGLSVCYYVTGKVCNTFPNLTLLAEPHTLEHDHSFSREDYHMAYSGPKKFNNNQNFNASIFDSGTSALGSNKLMNYSLANQVRLQRVSKAWQSDLSGWFLGDPIVQGVELGFIFGVMSDPTQPDFNSTPKVRVDWWKYWTVNESFPTPLGWRKPDPPRNDKFVFSVSSAVLHAPVTSTPSPQPPSTLTVTNLPLQTKSLSTVYPLPTDPPYVAPASGSLHKRADGQGGDKAALPVGPSEFNPYVDVLSPEQWGHLIAARRAHVKKRMAKA